MARSTMATVVLNAEDRASYKINALGKQVVKLTRQVTEMGKKSEKSTKKQVTGFEKLYDAARKYFYIFETGRRIAQVFNAAVIAPLKQATQQSIDFEKALAEVSTLYGRDIVDPSGTERMKTLVDTVKDFSFQFAKMPVDQAKALYFAISAGALKAADATELLRVTNMLATAGMVDAETATRSLTTVINAFSTQLVDANKKFEDAERVSDLYFITVQKGVTTIGELAPKIGRVASSAATAGMSMETMFALIAAGTKAIGRTPYTITGMAAAIKNVLSPTGKSKKAFKEMGLSFGIATTQGNNFAKLMETIGKRFLKPVGDAARITAADIDELFPRARASRFVMAVIGNSASDLMNTLAIMEDKEKSAKATREAYAKITATAAFQQERFKVATNLLGIEIGDIGGKTSATAGAYRGMSIAIMQSATALRDLNKSTMTADESVQDMAQTASAFGIMFASIVMVVVGLVASIINAMLMMSKTLGHIWSMVVLKIASAVEEAFYKAKNTIASALTEMGDAYIGIREFIADNEIVIDADGFRSWKNEVQDSTQSVIDFLASIGSTSVELEIQKLKLIENQKEIKNIGGKVKEAVEAFASFEKQGLGAVGAVKRAWAIFKSLTSGVKEFGGEIDDLAMDKLLAKLRALQDGVDGSGDAFKLAGDKLKGYANALSDVGAAMGRTDFSGLFKHMPIVDQLKDGTLAFKFAKDAMETQKRTTKSGRTFFAAASLDPEESAKKSGALIAPKVTMPNYEAATASLGEFISGLRELGKTIGPEWEAAAAKLGPEGLKQSLGAAADFISGYGGIAVNTLISSGMKAEEIISMIRDLQKASAEDLTKLEAQATKDTITELEKRLEARLSYNDIIKKYHEERIATNTAREEEISEKYVEANKEAATERKKQVREAEQTAQSIASTMVNISKGFISDLMNKEVTAAEAIKNLGMTLLEMALTSLAQFIIAEGIKSALLATTATTAVVADQVRLTSGLTVDAALLASSKALEAQKQSTALAGSGLGALGMIGIAAAAIAGIGGWIVGKSMKAEKEREARASGYGQRLSRGGLVSGGTPGTDSVSALLMPGEFVLPKSTVDSIRQGKPPPTPGRYATGGMVTAGGGAQIVFAPSIQTLALPTSVQNQRYYRDTVSKSRARLAKTGRLG